MKPQLVKIRLPTTDQISTAVDSLIVVVIARASRRARTLCQPAARRSAPRARIGGVLLLGREGVLVIGVR
jgi:hypothetical protein